MNINYELFLYSYFIKLSFKYQEIHRTIFEIVRCKPASAPNHQCLAVGRPAEAVVEQHGCASDLRTCSDTCGDSVQTQVLPGYPVY